MNVLEGIKIIRVCDYLQGPKVLLVSAGNRDHRDRRVKADSLAAPASVALPAPADSAASPASLDPRDNQEATAKSEFPYYLEKNVMHKELVYAFHNRKFDVFTKIVG